jgi:hypothetical protein
VIWQVIWCHFQRQSGASSQLELQDVQIQMHRLYNNACEQIMLHIIYAFARFADEAA